MADEVIGVDTQLSGTALGSVLTVRDIEGPNEEADDIDISSNVDADAAFEYTRRYKKGMVNPGEITATCVFTEVGYAAARTALALRTGQAFTITAEQGSTLVTGDTSYVKSVSASYPWEAEAVYDIAIKCSGKSTFTA
jgi:hypothetical protein